MPVCPSELCGQRNTIFFDSLEALMGHAHESRPQHPLCDPCQRVFKDKLSRQQHMDAKHVVHCDKCDRKFYSPSALEAHFRASKENIHPKCRRCNAGMRDSTALATHMQVEHTRVRCCGMPMFKDELPEHYLKWPAHPSCEVCQAGFESQAGLDEHNNLRHPVNMPTCSICGKEFQSEEELGYHIDSVHRVVEVQPTCSICDKRFRSEEELGRHMQEFGVHRRCEWCSRQFKDMSSLIEHSTIEHMSPKANTPTATSSESSKNPGAQTPRANPALQPSTPRTSTLPSRVTNGISAIGSERRPLVPTSVTRPEPVRSGSAQSYFEPSFPTPPARALAPIAPSTSTTTTTTTTTTRTAINLTPPKPERPTDRRPDSAITSSPKNISNSNTSGTTTSAATRNRYDRSLARTFDFSASPTTTIFQASEVGSGFGSRPSSTLPTPRGWAMSGPSGYALGSGSERTIGDVATTPATAVPATTVTPAPTFAAVAATSNRHGNRNGNGHSRGVSNDYGRVVMPSPSTSEYSDVDVTDWVRTQGGRSVSNPTITNAGTPERDLASNANANANGNTTPNGKRVPTQLFETPPSSLYPYRIEQTPPSMHAHSHSYPTYEQNSNNNAHGGLTSGPSSPPASSRSKHSFAETPSGDLSNHNLLNGSPLQPMRDVMGLGAPMTSMSAAMNMNTRGDIAAAMAMLNDDNAARNGSPAGKGTAGTGVTPMLSHTANGNGGPGSAGTNRSGITATRLPTFFDDDDDDGEDEDDLGVPMEDSPKSQIRVLGPSSERQGPGLNGSGKNTRRKNGPSLPSFHCRLCFSDPCEEPTATVCGHIFCNRCIVEEVKRKPVCPVCRTTVLLFAMLKLDVVDV